ncbi:hydroxyacid dehydrogenase [Microlunatus sp. Y2014]|uniref:hydroxyacid dehydrogenase n=1 Tax=Microlunatus sp. Y2014 TaxID=3418488 RepID=UPI003DA73EAA
MTTLPRAVVCLPPHTRDRLFTAGASAELARITAAPGPAVISAFDSDEGRDALHDAEIVVTGWGSDLLTEQVLAWAPHLRAVFHAAGSVRAVVTPAVWDRELVVCSAADANAIPVAEFTLASILYAGKQVRSMAGMYRESGGDKGEVHRQHPTSSNLDKTVGLIGLSRVGRRVADLMRMFDHTVLVHDPYATAQDARRHQVELVGLPELMRRSDIVSVHAPALSSTRGLVGAAELALMRDGATLINTARPSLLDTAALTAELVSGRIWGVLDVTDPEPLPADSVLFTLPNVQVTPHVAGALGSEIHRLGALMIDEICRYGRGAPLHHQVVQADLARVA